jgi:hypothetical protein
MGYERLIPRQFGHDCQPLRNWNIIFWRLWFQGKAKISRHTLEET